MRGHLRLRGKKWYGVYNDLTTGKQVWKPLSERKREAERALRDIVGSIDAQTYVPPSKQTFGEFLLNEWLPARDLKPSTAANYAVQVAAYVVPALGNKPIQELTAADLNKFYRVLAASGRRRDGKGLGPKAIRNVHVLIHKALADALRWGRVMRNVASLAEPPRAPRTEMKVWSADELRAFLGHVREDRLSAAWLLAATTGMRRAELLGLRWSDLDLTTGRLSVRQTATLVRSEISFGTPKTAKGHRSISLDPATIAALRAHHARQAEERLAWGSDYRNTDLVFAQEDGSPVHPERLSDAFVRHAKAAGLPRIRLHDVRHSYATAALTAGIAAKVVSERLGHASIGITLDTYSHVLPSLDEQAAATVAALILGTH